MTHPTVGSNDPSDGWKNAPVGNRCHRRVGRIPPASHGRWKIPLGAGKHRWSLENTAGRWRIPRRIEPALSARPGSVTLSAAKSPHRRVAATRPRVFAPKGRRNVATGGVPACRDGTRGHFVRMYSRPGWGGGSSIAAHAIQRWSIPRPPTGPAVPWGLAPTGSARACRPSLHPWQQSSAPFGAAESVTDPLVLIRADRCSIRGGSV
jgi:hypothetical protein